MMISASIRKFALTVITTVALITVFAAVVEARPSLKYLISSLTFPPLRLLYYVSAHITMALRVAKTYMDPK